MKLIAKTTLYYIGIAIIVFSIGGLITYNLISQEIAKETDYYLANSLKTIEKKLERAVTRGWDLKRFNTNQVQVVELTNVQPSEKIDFSDTLAMHPHLNQMETMRKLKVIREVGDRFFEITMIDVFVEDSDIYESVVQIITRLFALFALAFLIGSFFISRHLLRPFRATLKEMEAFNVNDQKKLVLPKTSTTEFSELNRFLNQMTDRAQIEYQALKKFSEDASHEIQTPLAIAKGKLDLLADTADLQEQDFKLIEGAQKALHRLSQLSRSLTLLTKIGNEEFDAQEQTDISDMVNETVENFEELFKMKDLHISHDIEKGVVIAMNRQLGGIMLNNLLHNAIKHNDKGGYVNIALNQKGLKIVNSGAEPTRAPHEMFKRFEKDSTNGDSTGLGLAIVKEICDYHHIGIDYTFSGDHEIAISF